MKNKKIIKQYHIKSEQILWISKNNNFVQSVIIGTLLGGSCTIHVKDELILSLKYKVVKDFKEYLEHILSVCHSCSLMDKLSFTKIKIFKNTLSFSSRPHNYFNFYYDLFYLDESFNVVLSNKGYKKIIKKAPKVKINFNNTEILNTLKIKISNIDREKYITDRILNKHIITPCVISYWYMESGYFNWQCYKYCINVGNWDIFSIKRILKIIKEDLLIETIYDYGLNLVYIEKKSEMYFEACIKEYMLPLFKYKLKDFHYEFWYNEYYFFITLLIILFFQE